MVSKRVLGIIFTGIVFLTILLSAGAVQASGGNSKTEISSDFDAFEGWEAGAVGDPAKPWNVYLDDSKPNSPPFAVNITTGTGTNGIVYIMQKIHIELVAETKISLSVSVNLQEQDGLVFYFGTEEPTSEDQFEDYYTELMYIYQDVEMEKVIDTQGETEVYVAIGLRISSVAYYMLIDDIEMTIERGATSRGASFVDSMITFGKSLGVVTFAENWKSLIMIGVSFVMFFLAIKKKFEPLLLVPIAFGILMANIPYTVAGSTVTMMDPKGGVLYLVYSFGVATELFPLLIFMGVGAMTDFGPMLANPKTALLGGAAQIGIFATLLGALALDLVPGFSFSLPEAASVAIIGGADGPTTIYTASQLAPHMLGAVAIAAYSYMALVPIIQPPIMRALTTKKERIIKMEQLRPVSKFEKIMFPFLAIVATALIVPAAIPLVGMLMFGNILRESGVVGRLNDTAQNALMNTVVILLGITVGATMSANNFLQLKTIGILVLGLIAFSLGTVGGVLLGKLMCILSKGKINPLIGAAGVSAVPMAARTVQVVGQQENPENHLLMHAMGPNVAGVIGSAMAAGVLLALV